VDIVRTLSEGYDVGLLNDGIHRAAEAFNLDVLLLDTGAGLRVENMLFMAISASVVVLLVPDQQHYQGTGVLIEVARKLDVPQIALLVNKCPAVFDFAEVKQKVETVYSCPVGGVLPYSEALLGLASSAVYVKQCPDHPITQVLRDLVAMLNT